MTVATSGFMSTAIANLRLMLGDCTLWRALVADPDVEWAALAEAAGEIDIDEADADALARIRRGVLAKIATAANYVAAPRCGLRHNNDLRITKVASTGYELTGSILAFFEVPIPTAYQANYEDAYDNLTNLLGGLQEELIALHPQEGRIEITEIELDDHGEADARDHQGQRLLAAGLNIFYRGGTG